MSQYGARPEVLQGFGIIMNFEEAVGAIKTGLAVLQQGCLAKQNHFTFLLLFATGFERAMKMIIVLHSLKNDTTLIEEKHLKRNLSHNLLKIRDELISRCFTPEYRASRLFTEQDYQYLTNDPDFNELLDILHESVNDDRYLFLRASVDPTTLHGEWPERRWDNLAGKDIPDGEWLDNKTWEIAKTKACASMVARIEKFLRALVRLLVFTDLGDTARSVSVFADDFLTLDDKKLGQRPYHLTN